MFSNDCLLYYISGCSRCLSLSIALFDIILGLIFKAECYREEVRITATDNTKGFI